MATYAKMLVPLTKYIKDIRFRLCALEQMCFWKSSIVLSLSFIIASYSIDPSFFSYLCCSVYVYDKSCVLRVLYLTMLVVDCCDSGIQTVQCTHLCFIVCKAYYSDQTGTIILNMHTVFELLFVGATAFGTAKPLACNSCQCMLTLLSLCVFVKSIKTPSIQHSYSDFFIIYYFFIEWGIFAAFDCIRCHIPVLFTLHDFKLASSNQLASFLTLFFLKFSKFSGSVCHIVYKT